VTVTSDATWPEFKQATAAGRIAILPFGAHEQHGPHCPLATDTVLAAGLAQALADALDALLLPAIPYGETWNNEGFPGTLSLSFNTVQAILLDLGKGLKRNGVKALVVVNGHFGNRAPLELAGRTIKEMVGLPFLLLDYPGLEVLAAEICESKPAAPSFYHADEVETSLMLALRPEAVQMEKAQAEYPKFPATFGMEPVRLDVFCRSGVFGDPRPASAEKGRQLLVGLTHASLGIINGFLADLARISSD
jgi:creatinine amidohydrolase